MTVGQIVAQRARLVQVSAALTELALMVGLFVAYKAVRFVAADNVDLAMGHALQIRHFEAILGHVRTKISLYNNKPWRQS